MSECQQHNGYVCFWNGKQCEVYAPSLYTAKELAVKEFQVKAGRKKVKSYDVTVVLAEKGGKQVIHNAVD